MHTSKGLVSFIKGLRFETGYCPFEYKANKNYADFAKHFVSNPQIYNSDKLDNNELFLLFTTAVSSSSSFSSKISIHFETLRNLLINANVFERKNPITQRARLIVVQYAYSKEYLKFLDWMYTNYNHRVEDQAQAQAQAQDQDQGGKFLGMNEERYKYHLLIAIDRLNLKNNNYFDGNEEANETYIERLNFLIYDVICFTPYLYEINNFKFLNWFLTIIQKHHNSTTEIQHQYLYFKELVYSFMKYITSNSKLQILEYIHQNFHFILKKKTNVFKDFKSISRLELQKHLEEAISLVITTIAAAATAATSLSNTTSPPISLATSQYSITDSTIIQPSPTTTTTTTTNTIIAEATTTNILQPTPTIRTTNKSGKIEEILDTDNKNGANHSVPIPTPNNTPINPSMLTENQPLDGSSSWTR
ncbi:hypothetical protein ACTFIR_012075 [Dictyostelium discoideum]